MKKFAPATERNREPIAQVLDAELPATGTVLEIASGSGEHALFYAGRYPDLAWQPTDPDHDALNSITAWLEGYEGSNLSPPLTLDASQSEWPIDAADAIFCANMTHISPWEATKGLFAGAGRVLGANAPLILYGPYFEDEVEPAPSNVAFDQSLKGRDPRWGIRNVSDMDSLAAMHGFRRSARYAMPANNLTLVYRRQ